MRKSLKHFRTHIMKDCGHAPMVERPEETAGYIINFLENDIGMRAPGFRAQNDRCDLL